jgi:hypothetical protein
MFTRAAARRLEQRATTMTRGPVVTLGSAHDPAEAEADVLARDPWPPEPVSIPSDGSQPPPRPSADATGGSPAAIHAPPSVASVLSSPGLPLDTATRRRMERRLGHDFGHVRVHVDTTAAISAGEVGAVAYAVGPHLVFGSGRYAPASSGGQRLLAHELAHVVQASAGTGLLLRRQPDAGATTTLQTTPATTAAAGTGTPGVTPTGSAQSPQPRRDYVFLMGQDRPGGEWFFRDAERYYRAHIPGSPTFVTTISNLADLLSWVASNVRQPIGDLFIVSHANEDGTLSFGLDAADTDGKLSVSELRAALHPISGSSSLANVSAVVDATTRIRIKGCDIGRTAEMVELLDEAFGGAGTVNAPTHEQVYGTDPELERQARARFRTGVEASHPVPPPLDPSLRGAARTTAETERRESLRRRTAAVEAELQARQAEANTIAEQATTFEALSGPMFQRPGTQPYSGAELRPEVVRLYGHLSAAQQASLVQRLIAPDRRTETQALADGPRHQQGQRLYRLRLYTHTVPEPASLLEAVRLYGSEFGASHFTAQRLLPLRRAPATDGTDITIEIDGVETQPGQTSTQATESRQSHEPSTAWLIGEGRSKVQSPDHYAWRVDRSHSTNGNTTLTVVAERVVAYLHHASLDPSATSHFTRPETDTSFFTTSTFAPPVAPAAGGTGSGTTGTGTGAPSTGSTGTTTP